MKKELLNKIKNMDDVMSYILIAQNGEDQAHASVDGDDDVLTALLVGYLLEGIGDEQLVHLLSIIAKNKPVVFQSAIDLHNN